MQHQCPANLGMLIFLSTCSLMSIGVSRQAIGVELGGTVWELRAFGRMERPARHGVMLRDSFEQRLQRRILVGPEYLALTPQSDECFCYYRIEGADDSAEYMLRLRLHEQGEPKTLTVGEPVAALLPGQVLRDGPPTSTAGKTAYQVRMVQEKKTARIRIQSICLPVEYRHHFERLELSDDAPAFGILDPAQVKRPEEVVGIVDDLGARRGKLDGQFQKIIRIQEVEWLGEKFTQ